MAQVTSLQSLGQIEGLFSRHPTAQVGCDIFKLPGDGYGHGSSSCCDGVRAVNAIACVSRSLRCFLQGRRENECHTEQADAAT